MTLDFIFTVNPGTTTTRCALYRQTGAGVQAVVEETMEHGDAMIRSYADIAAQVDFRDALVTQFIDKYLQAGNRIVACAGRGGMLTPVPSGVIAINEELVHFSLYSPVYNHASNLGAPLAFRAAQRHGVQAYIVDPVCVDEFTPVARLSGTPLFNRFSFVHALNIRATTRKLALQLQRRFEDLRVVAAHLGAGFSIAAVDRGRIVDNDNRMECAPFTPERAGGVPPIPLIDACYSGRFGQAELTKRLYGEGGVYAYLGTRDMREVEQRIDNGDARAALVYDAMLYQIGKSIGVMASVMNFRIDGVLLTGGLANSLRIVEGLREKIGSLAPLFVFPGSNENESLAEAVARVLQGDERVMNWPVSMPAGALPGEARP